MIFGETMKPKLTEKEIEEKTLNVIAESLCRESSEVHLKSNLMSDLGAESIDLLDIMFRLEKEFSIKIPQREIEKKARAGLSDEEFEVNSILQPKGITRMRELLPEINPSQFKEGMSLREIPGLFTAEVFVSIVRKKLYGDSSSEINLENQNSSELRLR